MVLFFPTQLSSQDAWALRPGGPPIPEGTEAGYLRVGPDSLFYEVMGQGPILVMVHDGLIHREVWENQFPVFAQEYRVVRYDRRGYGASPVASAPFSDVEDLAALFQHLEIETATLMGMSSGGQLTIDFTLAQPDRVEAMVLVGAVVRGLSYTQHMLTRGGRMSSDFSDEEILAYIFSEDPYEIYRENRNASQRLVELGARGYRPGEREFTSGFTGTPSVERLGELQVPTLILAGEFDIPDVHAHAGAIHAGIRGSRREIISDSGHLIPLEQPEAFNRVVLEFLRGG
jgi:pimeloyl-ACP methyl ester carboxylesterase